jgi:uncharacterized protein involved in tellurium resistance
MDFIAIFIGYLIGVIHCRFDQLEGIVTINYPDADNVQIGVEESEGNSDEV